MVRFTILVATGAALLAAGGAGANPQQAGRPNTLVAKSPGITRFAQDGNWLGWTTTDPQCRRRLALYSLRQHRPVVVRQISPSSCYDEGLEGLALAGDRAAWTALVASGNTELDIDVYTLSAHSPKPHLVRQMALERNYEAAPPDPPPLAGQADKLVYYRHEDGIFRSTAHTVEQILDTRPKRLFGANNPVALAVGSDRVVAVRGILFAGDACNCNFDPAWSPDGAKLAFASGRRCCFEGDETAEIYVQNADGSGKTAVTNDQRPKLGIAWSPDGTRLAFGYLDAAFSRRVAVANADGTGRHDVVDGENPAWSPDGTKLAYDDGQNHILVANADGSGPRLVADGVRPAWSPDGTRLAFDNGYNQTFTSLADGSDRRVIAVGFSQPAWSPDGSEIAGATRDGIGVVDAGGGTPTWIPQTQRGDADPSWSPAGTRILFDSVRNDLNRDSFREPELYVVRTDGSDLRAYEFREPGGWWSSFELHTSSGRLLYTSQVPGAPLGVAITGKYRAVLSAPSQTDQKVLSILGGVGRTRSLNVAPAARGPISASDGRVVLVAGRTIWLVNLRTQGKRVVAVAHGMVVGLAISGRRVTWAENSGKHGYIRTLSLPTD